MVNMIDNTFSNNNYFKILNKIVETSLVSFFTALLPYLYIVLLSINTNEINNIQIYSICLVATIGGVIGFLISFVLQNLTYTYLFSSSINNTANYYSYLKTNRVNIFGYFFGFATTLIYWLIFNKTPMLIHFILATFNGMLMSYMFKSLLSVIIGWGIAYLIYQEFSLFTFLLCGVFSGLIWLIPIAEYQSPNNIDDNNDNMSSIVETTLKKSTAIVIFA